MSNYSLSFVTRAQNGTVKYWNAPESGADLAKEGRRRADELCDVMRASPDAVILFPHVARAIGESGAFSPLEAAFFHRVAELAA